MTTPPDSIARTTALLEACGFTVFELARPVRGVWQLVAVTGSHPGVLLVGILAEIPDPLNPRLAMPGGLHPASRRLVHVWPAEAALPVALHPVGTRCRPPPQARQTAPKAYVRRPRHLC